MPVTDWQPAPAHDAAFDKGMITVNGGLRIHLARSLADAVQADALARQFYGRPPLREVLLFPSGAQMPARSTSTGIERKSSFDDTTSEPIAVATLRGRGWITSMGT